MIVRDKKKIEKNEEGFDWTVSVRHQARGCITPYTQHTNYGRRERVRVLFYF